MTNKRSNLITVTNIGAFQSTADCLISDLDYDKIISVTPFVDSNTGGYTECINVGVRIMNNKYWIKGYTLTTIPSSVTLNIGVVIQYIDD